MAQIISIICDAHLEDGGAEVKASPYRLGFASEGGSWTWVEVDLCPDHAAPLEGVLTATAALGRTFDPRAEGTPTSRKRAPSRASTAPATSSGSGVVKCPVCGREYVSRSSAASHIRNVHPEVNPVAVLPPPPTRRPSAMTPCPDCGKPMGGRQGLAAHAKAAHGKTLTELEAS